MHSRRTQFSILIEIGDERHRDANKTKSECERLDGIFFILLRKREARTSETSIEG